MAYSYSALSTFETCPLRYRFTYVDKLSPVRENIEGFLGARIHETLEKLYRDLLYERHMSLDELHAFFNERWSREMCTAVSVTKDYDIDNYRKMGERYISDYYRQYRPFDEGKTIALEKRVFFPIDERYWIVGVIDRITEVGGVHEVHDYKTSLYLPTKKDIEQDCQLALYAMALDYLYNVTDIELVWHFLAFNREIRLKKESYDDVRKEIVEKIKTIERAKVDGEFPSSESPLCSYCGYQPMCPLFKHKYTLDTMEKSAIATDDGVALVNKYNEIINHMNQLKHEQEELERAILDYSRNFGVQHVYGSDVLANVKTYQNIQFTDKEQVEGLVKKEGLFERYGRLDMIKLAREFQEGTLPLQIRGTLLPLTEKKEVNRIYLRKVKGDE